MWSARYDGEAVSVMLSRDSVPVREITIVVRN